MNEIGEISTFEKKQSLKRKFSTDRMGIEELELGLYRVDRDCLSLLISWNRLPTRSIRVQESTEQSW